MNLFKAVLLSGLILSPALQAKPGVYQCHGDKEQKWSATVDKVASKITIRFADQPPLEVPMHQFEGSSGGFDASGSNKKQRVSATATVESCELGGAAYPYSVVITRNAQELTGCCGFGAQRAVPPARRSSRDSDRSSAPRDSGRTTDERDSSHETDPRDNDRTVADEEVRTNSRETDTRDSHRFVDPRDSSRSAED